MGDEAVNSLCEPSKTNGEIWDGLKSRRNTAGWDSLPSLTCDDLTAFAGAVRADERARLAKPVATPKVRRTGGQKLHDSLQQRFSWRLWNECGEKHRADLEEVAHQHGILDDPKLPTDGELMMWAYHDAQDGTDWSVIAADFLRRRAERDGC